MEDQDCDENMPTGLTAMIQDDDDDDVSITSDDHDEKTGGGGGGGGGAPYNMQITPATTVAEFLPFQQMNPGEYPCSEEIIFHDLEKVLKSSAMFSTSHHYLHEEMLTEEILLNEDEVQENEPGQTGGELCQQQKRKRSSYLHNLNEKVRRQRLQGKMKALQQLIPNCNKSGKGHVLDEAIRYIRTLQHQVQENEMMSLMGSGGNFSALHSPLRTMPQLPAGIQIPTHPQFPPNDDPTGIDYGFGMGMGMGIEIPTNHSGLLNYPYAMESPVSGLSATSSSSRRLVPEPAHSSIQNYSGDYVIPPWHGISFPTSVSQCTTSPAQGTTAAGVLPSQLLLDNVARESRSTHSGSSERDTSSSIAKFQGYP